MLRLHSVAASQLLRKETSLTRLAKAEPDIGSLSSGKKQCKRQDFLLPVLH